MIYIITAMSCEAKPFISYLNLKQDNNITKFRFYKNDNVSLIISGVGKIKAAIATTLMLNQYKISWDDIFINVGVCGLRHGQGEKGNTVLCHKIIDHDTEINYYPDILFKHSFTEGVLETFSTVMSNDRCDEIKGDYVDMEGSAVFESASVFLAPHQINCIKIISDYLDTEKMSTQQIQKIVHPNVQKIWDWIETISNQLQPSPNILTTREEQYLQEIIKNLKLSTTMSFELKKLAEQYKVRFKNLEILQSYIKIIANSKNEGKIYFAKLKDQLTEY